MTRASLLHILDHVSEISDAEIRELEQLAAAFPYCQTAHILLAKTAHDRGSMLASQRLRRAATYAANRDLLRQLLEQPAPAGVAEVVGTGLGVSSAPLLVEEGTQLEAELPPVAADEQDVAEVLDQEATDFFSLSADKALEPALVSTQSPFAHTADATVEETVAPEAEATASIQDTEPTTLFYSEEVIYDAEVIPVSDAALEAAGEEAAEVISAESSETQDFSEPVATTDHTFVEVVEETQEEEYIEVVAIPTESSLEVPAVPETQEPVFPSSREPNATKNAEHTGLKSELQGAAENSAPLETTLSSETVVNDLLPATAPPIRPPAEAGISRFEFELVEPTLPEPSGYLLPDLEEEVAEEPIVSSILQRTAPAFHADEDLGYALGAGSRLGYDLQPHDGFTLDLPLDAFFEPDALLLAHIAAHRPKPSTTSLDLINRFLKTKPRIKTAALEAKPVEEQADLSVRSIQAAPALASESLAKIMVKQGKIDKAIEIYERLMARQPEKKAYFADQIQQLKQPSA